MTEFLADAWLMVFDVDGAVSVCVSDEPRVNAAVSLWLDSGRSRDTLLDLTTLSGGTYYTRASQITSWFISTPEHRRAEIQHSVAVDEEGEAIKVELGITWRPDA